MSSRSRSVSVPFYHRAWTFFGSLELTSVVLVLMMVLVLFGTLEQVHLGTWLAQKKYFSSWLIFYELENGGRLPVFPGGYTVGGLWLINLAVSHVARARWEWRRFGLLLTHGGLFLLVLGQGLTQMWAQESQMAIEEGHSARYSEDYRHVELVVIDTHLSTEDVVHAVPAALLKKGRPIQHASFPFKIIPKQFFQNSVLKSGSGATATMGVGARLNVLESPRVTSDDEMDTSSAVIELVGPEKSYGVWLVSTGLETPQTVVIDGTPYLLQLRPVRHYYPFSLHLKRFTHDRYPGTDIPKNFSSLLRLVDPETGDDRDVLIFMNNPLRYRGLTFYQASFGKGDKLSILQVVKNPVWVAPYLACVLVSLGLAWHFVLHLARFRRRAA
ncbi:MAG: cytochrome c biogenesis protein ResB [Elusimicrobia bacterium]|nr:cytochrome c biogenesis protein ResB [Elusimicrobiota bacterium]